MNLKNISKLKKNVINIFKPIRKWYYKRLYHRLFWNYAAKSDDAYVAIEQANQAFYWLTGYKVEHWL